MTDQIKPDEVLEGIFERDYRRALRAVELASDHIPELRKTPEGGMSVESAIDWMAFEISQLRTWREEMEKRLPEMLVRAEKRGLYQVQVTLPAKRSRTFYAEECLGIEFDNGWNHCLRDMRILNPGIKIVEKA